MSIRSRIGKALGSFIAKSMADESVVSFSSQEKFFEIIGGTVTTFSLNNYQRYIKAFNECPPLSATLLSVAGAATNGKVWVLEKDTEDEAESDYAKLIRRLFTKPNAIQTWNQFYSQATIMKRLCGFAVILVTRSAGFSKITESSQMWVLPPWLLEMEINKNFLYLNDLKKIIKSITVTFGGVRTPIKPSEIIILRDISPSIQTCAFTNTDNFLPVSRNNSLTLPIQTVIAAMKSNNVIIKRRGGIGILSNQAKDQVGHIEISPNEKKEIQEKLQTNYGLSPEQSEIIVTSAALNWQPMTFDAKQLMLHESIANASRMICSVHGWDFKLLSDPEGASYNNINELKKKAYQDTVIPECENDFQTFAEYFKAEENDIDLLIDFTHVEVLQKNKKETAQALLYLTQALEKQWRNNMITRNQYLQALEMPTIPNGDVFYYEFLKETGFVDTTPTPVNNNENNNNN